MMSRIVHPWKQSSGSPIRMDGLAMMTALRRTTDSLLRQNSTGGCVGTIVLRAEDSICNAERVRECCSLGSIYRFLLVFSLS